jgi:cellulose synthase/poly-beta-1,6-N-acetylglucosamine synthase-like glycosyltransferase
MLAALLLAALVAAVLSSVALFVPVGGRGRAAGSWAATRRLVLALVGTVVLAAVLAAALELLDSTRAHTLGAVTGFAAASLLWLPATRRWSARAHLCWASSTLLFVTYLAFILDWTIHSGLGPLSTVGGLLLWLLELGAAVLSSAYLWELCDVLGTEHWQRRITRRTQVPEPAGGLPFVSLQVPAYNEPPDMVIATLKSLLAQDYPAYEIIAIDDNSDDEQLWRPVEAWCGEHGVKFTHLQDWPGYKSGALNYALRECTDPRAELIGVVDSDYQLDPGFLRRTAPLFADPRVGFIQAPQDYRDWQGSSYFRRLYYSYRYFFSVSQPSRNEHDGAIFAGTMGLIRRDALVAVGGWDEWCITEDAELSLRVLRGGWSGLHVDESLGRGVMPLTFEALKSQRYRWCFGGIQILRMHWRSMLPGARSRRNELDLAQRWAYLTGAVQWYGDVLGLAFFGFLMIGAANLAFGGGDLFRKLTVFLVATVPVLVLLGLARAVALVRRGTGASWADAFGAFFIWQATSLVVARASVQGLFARKAAFLRTPKTSEQSRWWEAIGANWLETTLALFGVAGIVIGISNGAEASGLLLAGLLLVPTLGFAAAPFNSLAAQRATLPEDLRQRRRTEWLRAAPALRQAAVGAGAAVAVAGAVALVAVLLAPTPRPVRPPDLLRPAQGRPTPVASTGPSGTSTPAPSPSGGTPTATGTATATDTGTASDTATPTDTATDTGTETTTPTDTAEPTVTATPTG